MTDVSHATHADMLAHIELFAGLDRVALATVAASLDPLQLQVGEAVLRQGQVTDSLYLLVAGSLGVYASSSDTVSETRISTIHIGECFGEMSLLTGQSHSATVRAETASEVLQLEGARFRDLHNREVSVARAVSAMLIRRLRSASDAVVQRDQVAEELFDQVFARLPFERRQRCLKVSLLGDVSDRALRSLFGSDTDQLIGDLQMLGLGAERVSGLGLEVVGRRAQREVGERDRAAFVAIAAHRLETARLWDDALKVLAGNGPRAQFVSVLRLACQASPRLDPEVAAQWTERLTDDEATYDAELAIARAHCYERRGDGTGAAKLLQQALSTALLAGDTGSAQVIAEASARLSEAGAGPPSAGVATTAAVAKKPGPRFVRPPIALVIAIALCVCAVITTVLGIGPAYAFLLLLAGALVLWFSAQFVESVVALGLMAGWVILGIAKPADAAAGFSSSSWIFALGIFGLATAVARSGLLFRIGLLLVKRLPATLAWQASGILLTGLLLEPLLPGNTGRVALVMPLARTIAEALRIEDRKPAAVVLGMSAWIGSGGPLQFLFLNGAPVCLLAWGLLPAETRQRFDWTFWLVAAAPLAVFVAGGAIVMLFVLLRPPQLRAPQRDRLETQLAILGPPTSREWSMIGILLLTVASFVLAPSAKIDPSIVAILALVAAVAAGNLDGPALREINWNQLILIGVILSSVGLVVSLGIDRLAAETVGRLSGGVRIDPLLFILLLGLVTMVVRLVVPPQETVLLLGLPMIPVAQGLAMSPWIVIITILAVAMMWFLPTQTNSYLVAFAASDGRLFSHAQARRVAFGYAAVVLCGLALMVPYWHALGLV